MGTPEILWGAYEDSISGAFSCFGPGTILAFSLSFDGYPNLTAPKNFDRHFKFPILGVVSPSNINVKEGMRKLSSFRPIRINIEHPSGLAYQEQN